MNTQTSCRVKNGYNIRTACGWRFCAGLHGKSPPMKPAAQRGQAPPVRKAWAESAALRKRPRRTAPKKEQAACRAAKDTAPGFCVQACTADRPAGRSWAAGAPLSALPLFIDQHGQIASAEAACGKVYRIAPQKARRRRNAHIAGGHTGHQDTPLDERDKATFADDDSAVPAYLKACRVQQRIQKVNPVTAKPSVTRKARPVGRYRAANSSAS